MKKIVKILAVILASLIISSILYLGFANIKPTVQTVEKNIDISEYK